MTRWQGGLAMGIAAIYYPPPIMKGIALKVTYNDGGSRGGLFGFNSVCSNRNMLVNIRDRKMVNCSAKRSPCRRFVNANFKGRRPPKGNCYEALLFKLKPLRFGCGFFHNGARKGEAIPIKNVVAGDIAFLTTLLPEKQQHERIVFSCFRVAQEPQFQEDWGYAIESDGIMDIHLPDDVAIQMNFWRYYENEDGSMLWGAGLFRHMNENQTHALLSDLIGLLGDHPERDVLLAALGSGFTRTPVRRLSPVRPTTFGGGGFSGGESDAHRTLKEFVAKNPQRIGLPKESAAQLEFVYDSGDKVDVKFNLPDGTHAVVEIETINAWPGAHQCIKYRALLEASQGHPLGSGKVQAILVAHAFDDQTLSFAKKYNIRTVMLKL